MKQAFTDKSHLSYANRARLEQANAIIEEYHSQGYTLTLRQLYYQLVARGLIENQQREYVRLSRILTKGRMAGLVDWDSIVDRTRVPQLPYYVEDIENALYDVANQYRLDRQEGQANYLELWIEKDALSGVIMPVTKRLHVRLLTNRGYSSTTAMHEAAMRIHQHMNEGQNCFILYIGDFDPSGLDMIRDIEDRMCNEFGCVVEVVHLGLTEEQIKKYNPPPNPTKPLDPRSNWYIEQYGETCWEVDALDPKTLHELVESNIEERTDLDLFEEKCKQENEDKDILYDVRENYRELDNIDELKDKAEKADTALQQLHDVGYTNESLVDGVKELCLRVQK